MQQRGLLPERREVVATEMLGITLYIFSRSATYTEVHSRFQRSCSTIFKYHNKVIDRLCMLAKDVIRPYRDQNELHPVFKLRKNMACRPLKDAIGVIDGTHMNAFVNDHEGLPFFDKDKRKSWNALAVVDIAGRFMFVNTGWQGCAHDLTVLRASIRPEINFPHPQQHKYYLPDSGYVNTDGYLTPFKGETYHTP